MIEMRKEHRRLFERTTHVERIQLDKHGSYCAGEPLLLLTQDPKNRPFWRVPGRFEKKELEDHLVELFPEGLWPHGWRFMLDRYDYTRDPITNNAFVNHTWQVEFTFEMVRRAAFPKMNSRFQSYFAWETLDAAKSFREETQTIYRVQAEKGFRANQNWLTLGTQGVATSLCAHRYWSGAASSESLWEIVLRAPVRIVDRVE